MGLEDFTAGMAWTEDEGAAGICAGAALAATKLLLEADADIPTPPEGAAEVAVAPILLVEEDLERVFIRLAGGAPGTAPVPGAAGVG